MYTKLPDELLLCVVSPLNSVTVTFTVAEMNSVALLGLFAHCRFPSQ